MKAVRYIITRPCLQEGSLRLLKYIQPTFPDNGPAQFVDDRGHEHAVQVDRERGRVWGLGNLYRDGNLGVNDVLMITPLAPARYQVEAIVKPYAAPPPPPRAAEKAPEARRVVVSATPHVREVRLEQPRPAPAEGSGSVVARAGTSAETAQTPAAPAPLVPVGAAPLQPLPGVPQAGPAQATSAGARPAAQNTATQGAGGQGTGAQTTGLRPAPTRAPATLEEQLAELARLTGYRLDSPAPGVARLRAELGAHGYTVHLALTEAAARVPGWEEGADHAAVLTTEAERPHGRPYLTREALTALLEHARLAPLSPIDLRGYWRAGNLDLETAASVSELVGAHLAQRGAFSFVLLTLAAEPAHSVISAPRLAERLGSGVNLAELGSILDTLTRAPFLALTPLPGGQFLLRASVRDLLAELAEYAEGVRRRVRTPGAGPAPRQEDPLTVSA